MQRTVLHKLLAIVLAVYMPLITFGIPLHKHYCEGKLADSQWLIEVESCHDSEIKETSCCGSASDCHAPSEEEKEDCCENEIEVYKADLSLISYQPAQFKDFLQYSILQAIFIDDANSYHGESYIKIKTDFLQPYPNGQSRIISFQQFIC